MREVAALEQEPRAVRFGASTRRAIAEIQPGFSASFAVALERGDGDMRHFGRAH